MRLETVWCETLGEESAELVYLFLAELVALARGPRLHDVNRLVATLGIAVAIGEGPVLLHATEVV